MYLKLSCILAVMSVLILNMSLLETNVSVTLEVNHIRSQEGQLYIFLYNYENQYPDNPFLHLTFPKKDLLNQTLLCSLKDMPEGNYGMIILDDENANNDLDRFLGIPKEGFCFSNKAKPKRFRFPKYKDIVVNLGAETQVLDFRMQYIL